MCDTLGFTAKNRSVFGKNSDRSPNEPQLLEFIPASESKVDIIHATYTDIPQTSPRYDILLSRPSWLWGGEMGVNSNGVCIGNEAVWTKGKYSKTGLTGMDLLRAALERSEDAGKAVDIIVDLLEKFGQGGNCGYDHSFYYDNSFLVMDRSRLYVLETAGKEWVCRESDRASISNRLSVGGDGDRYSGGEKIDFARRHTDILYNTASGSAKRLRDTGCSLASAQTPADMMSALRRHNVENPFAEGTVSSVCMHFGGLVGDHTTASMVVDLLPDRTVVWTTGCTCPCVSLFKPWVFGSDPSPVMNDGGKYWYASEKYRRQLLGRRPPDEFYAQRDELESGWIAAAESGEIDSARCLAEEAEFYARWSPSGFEEVSTSRGFRKRWDAKNAVFEKEMAKRV